MAASSAQRLLEADLARADFRIGADKGYWSLAQPVSEQAWPSVFTWVAAAPRGNAPDRYLVRWDVAGYSGQSPTGAFWDDATAALLPKASWPKGRPGTVVERVFRTDSWQLAGQAFYHPYDRRARSDHNQWATDMPLVVWTQEKTLTDFLLLVHRWLNCEDYLGG